MKTTAFEYLLKEMTPTQQAALEELERNHSELLWDGGKVETKPLRVSIKNVNGKSMGAVNTREKDSFLRLEFRGRDYAGPRIITTGHKNFDKAFDLINYSDVIEASNIIASIKQRYLG